MTGQFIGDILASFKKISKGAAVDMRGCFIPELFNPKDHEVLESSFAQLLNDLAAAERRR